MQFRLPKTRSGLWEIGKKDEAVVMFNKALEIKPNNKDAEKMLKKVESLNWA